MKKKEKKDRKRLRRRLEAEEGGVKRTMATEEVGVKRKRKWKSRRGRGCKGGWR